MANLKYGSYYSDQPASAGSKARRFIIMGIVAAVILGGAFFTVNLLTGGTKSDLTLLAARENSLLQLANASQKTIRDPDLATANSNSSILLASDVSGIIQSTGIKKLPSDLVTREADTNTDKLKEAALLNKFDATYRQIVLDKVGTLTTQAQTIRSGVSNTKTRAQLDQIITNLQSIDTQFTQLRIQ